MVHFGYVGQAFVKSIFENTNRQWMRRYGVENVAIAANVVRKENPNPMLDHLFPMKTATFGSYTYV
jgi:hypothetical protein